MNKKAWKTRFKAADRRAREWTEVAKAAHAHNRGLEAQVLDLTRELEDKRKNWAPIKLAHPWEPRDGACKFCDDPREDPRHEQ